MNVLIDPNRKEKNPGYLCRLDFENVYNSLLKFFGLFTWQNRVFVKMEDMD